MTQPTGDGFRKSSYSAQTDACVEVRADADVVRVRDTTDRLAGTVAFSHSQWSNFLAAVAHDHA